MDSTVLHRHSDYILYASTLKIFKTCLVVKLVTFYIKIYSVFVRIFPKNKRTATALVPVVNKRISTSIQKLSYHDGNNVIIFIIRLLHILYVHILWHKIGRAHV